MRQTKDKTGNNVILYNETNRIQSWGTSDLRPLDILYKVYRQFKWAIPAFQLAIMIEEMTMNLNF